jgi:isoleucyl-tRNA synthetase
MEREILALWRDRDVFRRSVRGTRRYVFYDGPPFATGTPHYGHILAGTIKDIVPRWRAMKGDLVERRFGWDCHGLPVEMEIEKALGLQGPADILAYGVDRYNEACRSIVLRYTEQWRHAVERLGRWVDFDNDYKTMDPAFMESVWWAFRRLHEAGLVYRGVKVMPYSWRLGTPLSNFEANLDYRTVQDPAITVSFPLLDRPGEALLAWTTTPWTLPANLALCVGPDVRYALARRPGDDTSWWVSEALVPTVLGEDAEILRTAIGSDMRGWRYAPLFPVYADDAGRGAFVVLADPYVGANDGTGIVHQAPAFGEDDARVCQAAGLPVRDPVDAEGRFTAAVPLVAGQRVKEADPALIRWIKEQGRLFRQATIDHEYPFCWRSGTPLIYKAIDTWFVRVTALRERMTAHNDATRWVPEFVGSRRFGNWIADARDWAISRNRFWGTPLPIWTCTACGAMEVLGSRAELEERAGIAVPDLHKHFVDALTWPCACGETRRRVPEVLDCWFESGAMPYAQNHYPFENTDVVEQGLPADFIAEGLDQTRGWFYTLLVLSSALFDRPAFRNVVVNGLILAEDGQKMSKRLKNYPDPLEVVEEHGADALRAWLIQSPAVRAEPVRFSLTGVRDTVRTVLLPLWNAYAFFATYAAADGWTPPATPTRVQDRALLDRWITSRLHSTLAAVDTEFEAYRLYEVIPAALGFIDHLTNWYIRRSRRRFWRTEDDLDKGHAFETLYEVLALFVRILAPILPFAAEELYQRLEAGRPGAPDSVHLTGWPESDPGMVDATLEADMQLAREVVRLARNLREQHRVRVRQPLSSLTIAAPHPLPAELADVVADEINVKLVRQVARADELVLFTAKANFAALGRRLGPRMKAVAASVAALPGEAVARAAEGHAIDVDGETLLPSDLVITRQPRFAGAIASDGDITVQLDTVPTEELRTEGFVRELVARCQQRRKDLGLDVSDRIALSLHSADANAQAALHAWQQTIADELLAISIDALPGGDPEDVDGVVVTVRMARA